MILSLILAVTDNNVIGKNNSMPWHLPADMKYFRGVTTGHQIIMGRRTFESISGGKPLPGRVSIVLSRQESYVAPGCLTVRSLKHAVDVCKDAGEVFVIGGMQVYEQAMPLANKIYLTRIHATIEGDAFAPSIDEAAWRKTSSSFYEKDEKNAYDLTFEVWERI